MMTDLREAAQMALDALESKYIVNCGAWRVQQDKAIEALRAALAQPQKDLELPLVQAKEFVKLIEGKENFRGIPVMRTEWPTRGEALAQPKQEPVGNTITFMTRAIFNIVADHQEINGGYFIADGDVAAFVDRLAKVINSTFEPLKHKGSAPPQREWQGLTDDEQMQVAWSCGSMSADWLDFAREIEAKLREKNT